MNQAIVIAAFLALFALSYFFYSMGSKGADQKHELNDALLNSRLRDQERSRNNKTHVEWQKNRDEISKTSGAESFLPGDDI